MFKNIALATAMLAASGLCAPAHATEPAWWTQQKIDCGVDLDTAYNDWVAANSPCPRASGQSASGSATSQVERDLTASMAMSLMGGDGRGALMSGGLLLGLGLLNAGNQTPEQAAAQRRAREAQIAAEARRRQAAYEEEQRQEQLRLERNRQLLASLRGSVDGGALSMRGLESSGPLQLRPLDAVVDASVSHPASGPFHGAPTTLEQSHEYVIINQMRAHAASLGWAEDEQERLADTLVGLAQDVYDLEPRLVRYLWNEAAEHSTDPAVAASAAAGQGPDLYASGWQTGRYNDCVIFAVATATGTPYGVVSARAAEFVRAAEWRTEAQRANPLSVFSSTSGGLNGGETVLLAETFGRSQAVPFEDFASTVRSGRPVIVSVWSSNGTTRNKHQVVVSRTFEHGGETWFEIINSSERDPNHRTRIRSYELDRLITEAGVTITPEATVPMLR
ncbi:hypothetical protein U91I_03735 [alpha proteobacterium U9-1i]|nr:hypothetical protein U91I_03735 [alpha proteobacterium U9-1i]